MGFIELDKDIKKHISKKSGILDLYKLIRHFHIKREIPIGDPWYYKTREGLQFQEDLSLDDYVENKIENDIKQKLSKYINRKNFRWDDIRFHIENRVKSIEGLFLLALELIREAVLLADRINDWKRFYKDFSEKSRGQEFERIRRFTLGLKSERNKNSIRKAIAILEKYNEVMKSKLVKRHYVMSILPLNQLLPLEVLLKYIPEEDYFETLPPNVNPDPYGQEPCRVKVVNREGKRWQIGVKKFSHSLLYDIDMSCPIGCVGCYKTYYTREKGSTRIILRGILEDTVIHQTKTVVNWLNRHPEVYDIIISGGEPLLAGGGEIDKTIYIFKAIFDGLRAAKYLKIARICTGAIFQGLPFVVTDGILDIIHNFSKDSGKRFTFQAHLSNHYQFTFEALFGIRKIKERGINIYSQVPIQEGINFFRDDLHKSVDFLLKLGQIQVRAGIEPYKYIIDMHPRTIRRYVPLESALRVWSQIGESHSVPELERPKTFCVLFRGGNIILSGPLLQCMSKRVDIQKHKVFYRIPGVYSLDKDYIKVERPYQYEEPIIKGYNDNPKSLKMKNKID